MDLQLPSQTQEDEKAGMQDFWLKRNKGVFRANMNIFTPTDKAIHYSGSIEKSEIQRGTNYIDPP